MKKVYCYGPLSTYKENIRGLLKNSDIRFKNFKIKRWSQQASHSEPFSSIGGNQAVPFKKWKTPKRYIFGSIICTYWLSWGGAGGEGWIFAGRTDLVQRGAWVLPESQIFSGSAGPNSVNKHSYHMTIVLFNFLTRRSARFSSRAVPVFRANHLTPTALIPDFFSYGFPTKLRRGRTSHMIIKCRAHPNFDSCIP